MFFYKDDFPNSDLVDMWKSKWLAVSNEDATYNQQGYAAMSSTKLPNIYALLKLFATVHAFVSDLCLLFGGSTIT